MTPHSERTARSAPLRYVSGCLALALTDGRRKINLLQGRAAPRWVRIAIVCCYALGAMISLAAALGAGALAAYFGPVHEGGTDDLARYSWPLAVATAAALAVGAQPHQVRLVVEPPDWDTLAGLPIRSGQLLLVRCVLPAVLGATGLVAVVCAFLWAWLRESATGRELLPLSLTVAVGAVVLGTAAQICSQGIYALMRGNTGGILRGRSLVMAAGLGAFAGWVLALFTAALREQGPFVDALPRMVRNSLTEVQPGWWGSLLTAGPGWTALAAAAVALPLALLGGCALAWTARTRMLRAATPVRSAPVTRRAFPRSPLALFLVKDVYAALRGLPATTAVLRPYLAGSVAVGAAGIVHTAVTGGGDPLHIPLPAAIAGLIGGMLLVADEAVQTAGVEAERRAWDLLRQSPLSGRALAGYKAVSVACTTGAVAMPGALGWALISVGTGGGLLPLAAAGAAAAASCGAAAVAAAWLSPPVEDTGRGRVTRAPSASVLQTVLTWLPMLPTLAVVTFLPGGALLFSAPSLLVLAGFGWVAVMLCASPRTRTLRRPPPSRRSPTAPAARRS